MNMFGGSNKPTPTPAPPKTPVVHKDVTPNATMKGTFERDGKVIKEVEKTLDGFEALFQKDGNATIGCSLGKGVDFNSEKVTFFVNVKCDQNTETMDKAAEMALYKAMEYVNDAGEVFGWEKPK